MARLRGVSAGTGMVLGTAAIIQELNGIPIAPQPPERVVKELVRRRGASEKPDIVLAARDCRAAAALAPLISWGKVVAIVAETAPVIPDLPGVPVIGSIDGLLSAIDEDMLLLVDAGGSFVFPDPDPIFLAHYTTTAANLAPRRRIFLDAGHDPARTMDGVLIPVLGLASSEGELAEAIENGADGILLSVADPAACEPLLARATELASGKEILLMAPGLRGLTSVLTTGNRGQFTVLLSVSQPSDMVLGAAVCGAFRESTERLLDADEPATMPEIAVAVNSGTPSEGSHESATDLDSETLLNWSAEVRSTRLLLGYNSESLGEGMLAELDPWLRAAVNATVPAYVVCRSVSINPFGFGSLENTIECAVRLLVGGGASGIIVHPQDVQAVKAAVRSESAESCREEYRTAMQEVQQI